MGNRPGADANLSTKFMQFYAIQQPPKGVVGLGLPSTKASMPGGFRANDSSMSGRKRDASGQDKLDYEGLRTHNYDNDDDNPMMFGDNSDSDEDNLEPTDEELLDNIRMEALKDFREYCDRAKTMPPWTRKMRTAVELMRTLRLSKASLSTYDAVMEWHLKANGTLHGHASVRLCPEFVSRKKVFAYLRERYNMEKGYNNITKIVLPSCKNRADIVWNSAIKAFQSLLTDPRIRPEDYSFWGNDPFAPPPKRLKYIEDLNTGKAYTETWKKLITKPGKQVLLPTPIYIDGTATGQFAHLPITPVRIALGIFKREARDKDYMWRTLGYIPSVTHSSSRGRRLLIESGHVDGTVAYHESLQDEGVLDGKQACKAQDLHAILDIILAEYVKIQKAGFMWDLYYNGKLYKNVEFIPFVPFIKADTDEADKLCGSYSSRGKNVAQLCRYCETPTNECDRPMAKYRHKTPRKIQGLVDKNDLAALKALSQQCIENALYKLRFGQHNKLGVHGACAWDMLHMILLGIFKYMRDCFFEQIGPTSVLAKDIDALAREYGGLLSRQSDRNLPKTKFNNGITKGRLTAKEYAGVLLVILCVLKSTKGRNLVRKKGSFKNDQVIFDWCMLLETLLAWESWLKSSSMEVKHVNAADHKHRYIMYLIKKVAKRATGMGLKLTKFHAISHLVEDIRNFGVPLEVDCGSNESHHGPVKQAARLTQKKKETFDVQTAKRCEERNLLDLANEEFQGRPLWNYWEGYSHNVVKEVPTPQPKTGGQGYRCVIHPQSGHNVLVHAKKIKGKNTEVLVEQPLTDFIAGLQHAVRDYIGPLTVHSRHKRKGQIFRANIAFLDSVWRDWVIIDWGEDGEMPAKIWGFVDLTGIPDNAGISYGGLTDVTKGTYAIVESASETNAGRNEDSDLIYLDCDTDLFSHIETEIGHTTNGFVDELKFYLADVEAIVDPAVVVPNIGGKNNGYLWVENRSLWAGHFERWLEVDPKYDIIVDSDDEVEEEVGEDDEGVDEEADWDEDDEQDSENEATIGSDDEEEEI